MSHTPKVAARALSVTLLALTLAVTLVGISAPAQAQKVTPFFFGMHDMQIANGSTPGVPAGSIRLWDSGTSWREIETSPPDLIFGPSYDWSKLDAAVSNATTHGMRPMIVLGQTPEFYASNTSASGPYGPGASSMPSDINTWTRYVTAVAGRYGSGVDYQIWNEPNVSLYWSGTQQQMATLTATASNAIRAAVPTATIVAPSFPVRLSSQRTWFKSYWQQKVDGRSMASYVDVVSLQLYPATNGTPEDSMALLTKARGLLPDDARKKPVWSTEINYGLRGGPAADPIPSSKQASYVARTLLLNAGSPLSRLYWYGWAQGPVANTHLVQDDRTTLTRAGKTWTRVHDWIIGTSFSSCSSIKTGASKGVWTCKAKVSRTQTRRFYWKPSGKAAPVKTVSSTSSWTNMDGRTTKRKGSYTLKVNSFPIMVTSRR